MDDGFRGLMFRRCEFYLNSNAWLEWNDIFSVSLVLNLFLLFSCPFFPVAYSFGEPFFYYATLNSQNANACHILSITGMLVGTRIALDLTHRLFMHIV